MRRNAFLESVWGTVQRHEMLTSKDHVVIGVSGGPDSVALLRVMCWIWEKKRHRSWLCVAHLNHMLRGQEAEDDARFVKRLARKHRCLHFEGKVDVRALAAARQLSIEEAAREARYTYLEQVCLAVGANKLAVGHTVDDNVETVLQRLLRGTGVVGLAGIPPKRRLSEQSAIEIIRPLIETRRADVMDFLRRRRQPFRVDSSNLRSEYFRNRVRNELLPLLERQYNSNIREALTGLSHACAGAADFLTTTARKEFERLSFAHRDGGVEIPVSEARAIHPAVFPLVVRMVLDTLGVGLKQITRDHYAAMARLISTERGEKALALPNGLRVIRRQGRLRFERIFTRTAFEGGPSERPNPYLLPARPPAKGVQLALPGVTPVPGTEMTVTTEILQGGISLLKPFLAAKDRYEEMIDLEALSLPLILRARRSGERFCPLGARGSRKLQDFMVDEKIPLSERGRAPIVCDRKKLVWVVGYRLDDRVQVTTATRRVVRLSVQCHSDGAGGAAAGAGAEAGAASS